MIEETTYRFQLKLDLERVNTAKAGAGLKKRVVWAGGDAWVCTGFFEAQEEVSKGKSCEVGAGWCYYWSSFISHVLHFRCILPPTASLVCLGWKARRLVRAGCQLVVCWEGQLQSVHQQIKHLEQTSMFSFPQTSYQLLQVSEGLPLEKCLHCISAGLHSIFYELWKDIKTADTSIPRCQLSVAVIELLHLSQGRGEVEPQATGSGSEAANHTFHYCVEEDGGMGLLFCKVIE